MPKITFYNNKIMRYIRFNTEKQQYNLLNCTNINQWKDTCYTRATDFINVCTKDEYHCGCDIIQDETPTRWVNGTVCDRYDKYSAEIQEIYMNNTWSPTGNERNKVLIEANSADCGYKEPDLIFDWLKTDTVTSTTYYLNGTTYTATTTPVNINIEREHGITELTSFRLRNIPLTKITKLPDTSKLTSFGRFIGGRNVPIVNPDISNLRLDSVTSLSFLFDYCTSATTLTADNLYIPGNPRITDPLIYKSTQMSRSLKDIPKKVSLRNLYAPKLTKFKLYSNMTSSSSSEKTKGIIKELDLSGSNFSGYIPDFDKNNYLSYHLEDCLEKLNVTNMTISTARGLFYNLSSLTELHMDNITVIDKSDYSSLFYNVKIINEIPNTFDYTQAKDLSNAFGGTNIKEAIFNDEYPNLLWLSNVFENCENLTKCEINAPMPNLGALDGAFRGCHNLTNFKINTELPNLQLLEETFGGTKLTDIDLSPIKSNKLISFFNTFNGCRELVTLNLSGIRIDIESMEQGNVKEIGLGGCNKLATIIMNDTDCESLYFLADSCVGNNISPNIISNVKCTRYRWVDDGQHCDGTNLYHKLSEEKSDDYGLTWVRTGQYKNGELIQWNNEETCGYVLPSELKDFAYTYSGETSVYGINDNNVTATTSPVIVSLSDYNVTPETLTYVGVDTYDIKYLKFPDTSHMKKIQLFFNKFIDDLDVTTLRTDSLEDMTNMFSRFHTNNVLDLNTLNTSKVTTMTNAFNMASAENILIDKWDVSKVTDFSYLFSNASIHTNNINLTSWNPASAVDIGGLFSNYHIVDNSSFNLSGWKMPNLTDAQNLFYRSYYTSKITINEINLSNWEIGATDISDMFNIGDNSRVKISKINLSGWNTTQLLPFKNLFYGITDGDVLDISGWDLRHLPINYTYFGSRTHFKQVIMNGCDCETISKIKGLSSFYDDFYDELITDTICDITRWTESRTMCVDFDKYKKEIEEKSTDGGLTWNPTGKERQGSLVEENSADCGYVPPTPSDDELAFEYDNSTSSNLVYTLNDVKYTATTTPYSTTLADLGVDALTSCKETFFNTKLTKLIKFPNTSLVTTMYCMFLDSHLLTSLDLSHFNTLNVTEMSQMFHNCWELTELDLSSFNTSSLVDVEGMFWNCKNLQTLNLSGWNMTKIERMTLMFNGCTKLSTIYMRNCSQETISLVTTALSQADIPDGQVTIVTQ